MKRALAADQVLGGVIALLAVAATAAVFIPRCLGQASGSETEIVIFLKDAEDVGLTLPIAGAAGPLTSFKAFFARITVQRDATGTRAEAVTTLDFEGRLPPEAKVSAISVEHVPFALEARDWRPTGTVAPRLQGVVQALETRRAALEQGDLARLKSVVRDLRSPAEDPRLAQLLALQERRYRVLGWFIRIEDDHVAVKERYRLQGDLPDRPLDEEGEAQLTLVREGSQFFFAGGAR